MIVEADQDRNIVGKFWGRRAQVYFVQDHQAATKRRQFVKGCVFLRNFVQVKSIVFQASSQRCLLRLRRVQAPLLHRLHAAMSMRTLHCLSKGRARRHLSPSKKGMRVRRPVPHAKSSRLRCLIPFFHSGRVAPVRGRFHQDRNG